MNMKPYIPSDSEQFSCPFCKSDQSIRHYGGFETMNYCDSPLIDPRFIWDRDFDVTAPLNIEVKQATHLIGYRVICERCQKIIMDCEIDWQSAHKANVKSDMKRFFEVLYGTAA